MKSKKNSIDQFLEIDNFLEKNVLICSCCGEIYSLKEFSEQNPLEYCGECGAEYFLPYSRNFEKGYTCLEQYENLLRILPKHLIPKIPIELRPQLSPQSRFSLKVME